MAKSKCAKILCGDIWHIKSSTFANPEFESIPEGALAIDADGKVVGCDTAKVILRQFQGKVVHKFKNSVLVPGFVDAHVHFPQLDIIGCHGESLLGWLERYTYPEEIRVSKPASSKVAAKHFFDELLSNGTTTSLIFSSSDAKTTDILFAEAAKRGVRAIIGKTSMNRHAPKELLCDTEDDIAASKKLIKKWHGYENRLAYAISPRFAPSCTEDMLRALGELKKANPDLYVQTHFAESTQEIEWVGKLFPKHRNYLDVYDSFGLLGPRTLLAHGIHIDEVMIKRLHATNTKLVHCPTSNLFLGSGLFPMDTYIDRKIDVAVGTDIGGGTSFAIWTTLAESYKVQRLRNVSPSPEQLLYMATLGGARSLDLGDQIGNFEPGKYADVQVLRWDRKPLVSRRFARGYSAKELLFAMNFLFEQRLIAEVFVGGKSVYQCPSS